MRKHPLVWYFGQGLVIAIVLNSIPIYSNAAPKITAGAKCSVIHQRVLYKNTNYKCIKSGKKLLWNQGTPKELAKDPVPKDQSLPKLVIPTRVYQLLKMDSLVTPVVQKDIKYVIEDGIDEFKTNSAKLGFEKGIDFLNQLGISAKRPLLTLLIKSDQWTLNYLENNCFPSVRLNNFTPTAYLGFHAGICKTSDGVERSIVVQSFPPGQNTLSLDSIEFHHVLTHEYFHAWHSDYVTLESKWLRESGAQALTVLAFASWNRSRSYDQWLEEWISTYRRDQKTNCLDARMENLQDSGKAWKEECLYFKGILSIDVLIAEYGGIEGFKLLFRNNGTGKDFNVLFQESTGKSIDNFNEDTNNYFKSRGWSN
jgi:hypothetical protein